MKTLIRKSVVAYLSLLACATGALFLAIPMATPMAQAANAGPKVAGADDRARVVVSRDPSGKRPSGYREYMEGRDSSAPFQASLVSETRAGGGTVIVVVEGYLYYNIIPAIGQFTNDLLTAGYSVQVHLSSSSGTANDLRSYLQGQSQGLVGVVLVGNLPVPWFEIGYDFDGADADLLDNEYADFPCDLFYMDLDGTWSDNLSAAPFQSGVYDSHTAGSGDMDPDIWVSRLTSLPLGGNETTYLNAYFAKDRAYREGTLRMPDRALVYVDDDWVSWSSEIADGVAAAYPTRVLIDDSYTTCRDDYRYTRFFEEYEWMHVMLHSSAWEHFFKVGGAWEMDGASYATVTAADVRDLNPAATFYNLYTCSAARYTSWPYIGGYYLFNNYGSSSYGLAAVGTTKTGGMWDFNLFYSPLADNGSLGSAFQDWLITQAPYDSVDVRWFYGMTLLGDGTLAPHPRVVASSPDAYQTDVPVTADVVFEFDRSMLSTTLSTASFSLHGAQSGRHAGTYTCDDENHRILFDPSGELLDGEVVNAILSRKVRSSDNICPAPQVRTFTAAIGNPTSGSLSPWYTMTLGASDVATNLICTDLNGDRYPDLAALVDRPSGDQLAILLNINSGAFAAPTYYPAVDGVRWLVAGDFDGDYDTDLVTCTSQLVVNNYSLYRNNGNGTFAAAASFNGGAYPTEIRCGDFDGDGDLDLYTIQNTASDVTYFPQLLVNNGSGSFSLGLGIGWVKPTGFVYRAEAEGDVDGDGDLDLVGIGAGPGGADDSLAVFLNFDLNARMSPEPHRLYVRNGASDLCVNDFDGDGILDAAVVTNLESSLMVFHGNGDGTFSLADEVYHWMDAATSIAGGDWDGDGDIDLALGGWYLTYRRVLFLKNDGDGTFTVDIVWDAGADMVCCGDLDRDRDLDLATARTNIVSTLQNAGVDLIAPARILDLALAAAGRDTTITLVWTAPGDDGGLGRASAYRMRYSTSAVGTDTTAWWNAATALTGLPTPAPAGTRESYSASALPQSLCYFVMTTADEVPNWSPYSNVLAVDLRDLSAIEGGERGWALRCTAAPNPLPGRSRVEFAIPRTGRVNLSVYDLLGRRIAVLADGVQTAGSHALEWDTARIPSGVYFYRMEYEREVITRRVVVTR